MGFVLREAWLGGFNECIDAIPRINFLHTPLIRCPKTRTELELGLQRSQHLASRFNKIEVVDFPYVVWLELAEFCVLVAREAEPITLTTEWSLSCSRTPQADDEDNSENSNQYAQ